MCRCPIKAPPAGSNIAGCTALGMFFKGTVSEGWYFGSVKEQHGNTCVVKYGTTVEKTTLKTLIEHHNDEEEFVLPTKFWEDTLADMEAKRTVWRHTVEHGPPPEPPRQPQPMSEQLAAQARRKEARKVEQRKQQRSSGGSNAAAGGGGSGSGGGGSHDPPPLPPLPGLPNLPDGIPSWNDFQRQKVFKGQKNAEVASRWQQYQAAGRKGVGEAAVAAWEASEAKRAATKQAERAAKGAGQLQRQGTSGGGGHTVKKVSSAASAAAGSKSSKAADLQEQKWVAKMVKLARQVHQSGIQAKFQALYRQMKADLTMGSNDSSEETSDEDSHTCKRCGRDFDTIRGLLNHKRVCTADGGSSDSDIEPPDDIDSALSLERVRELIVSGDLLDREIEVWWDGDSTWFPGRVTRCDVEPKIAFEVEYEDGERQMEKVNKDLLIRLVDDDEETNPYANAYIREGDDFQCVVPGIGECQPLPPIAVAPVQDARVGSVEWDPTKVAGEDLHDYLAVLQKGADVTEDAMDEDKDADEEDEEKEPIPTDIGLRHLHSCSYNVATARRGLERLVEEMEVDELVLTPADARRFADAIKEYGKDFRRVCRAMNKEGKAEVGYRKVTVAQLTVFFYSQWKHTTAYRQWRRSVQQIQAREAAAAENDAKKPGRTGGLMHGKGANDNSKSSTFFGVTWRKTEKQWRAIVRSKGRSIDLGLFDDEFAAAKAYDKAAHKYHGKHAHLNFPEQGPNSHASPSARAANYDYDDFPEPVKAVEDLPEFPCGDVEMRQPKEMDRGDLLMIQYLRENDREIGTS
jgi:hypothetical protein